MIISLNLTTTLPELVSKLLVTIITWASFPSTLVNSSESITK